jgi:hypothetical protein
LVEELFYFYTEVEGAGSPETLIPIYQTIMHQTTENYNLDTTIMNEKAQFKVALK